MSVFVARDPVYLHGPSIALPERVVSNEDLIAWMREKDPELKLRASWIESRTGIRERRWVEADAGVSSLALAAGRALLEGRPELAASIRQVILATVSGDYPSPPTSPFVQHGLGLQECGAFDLGAACAGFVTGLHQAALSAQGTGEAHLLVAADIRSKFLNRSDFGTAVLFGDGAAAAVLSTESRGAAFRVLGSALMAEGSVADLVAIPAGGSLRPFTSNPAPAPEEGTLRMKDGAQIFLKAVHAMTSGPSRLLDRLGIELADVRWIVPHQANLVLVREIEKRLPDHAGRVIEVVSRYGNTSGSSVGLALAELASRPDLKQGDRILLTSAGGGGLAACALLERS